MRPLPTLAPSQEYSSVRAAKPFSVLGLILTWLIYAVEMPQTGAVD